jgi:hypothetical protein
LLFVLLYLILLKSTLVALSTETFLTITKSPT